MGMKKEIFEALDTLEAIHFLTLSLEDKLERINNIRSRVDSLSSGELRELLADLQKGSLEVREYYGTIPSDEELRGILAFIRKQTQSVYISKRHIDTLLFRCYDKVIPGWAQTKQHAHLVFDAQDNRSIFRLYRLENALWADVRRLTAQCKEAQSDEDRGALHTCLRCLVASVFHFLEAYLNGLAYDCFITKHDELPIHDHDVLAEWDSKKKRRKYVAFERKVFEYPAIVASAEGKNCELSLSEPAQLLVTKGKDLRDALTHPSPYVDPRTGEFKKTELIIQLNLELVELLVAAAKEYVVTVERCLGRDPRETNHYLFDEEQQAQ